MRDPGGGPGAEGEEGRVRDERLGGGNDVCGGGLRFRVIYNDWTAPRRRMPWTAENEAGGEGRGAAPLWVGPGREAGGGGG
jgi:hypothetical protein